MPIEEDSVLSLYAISLIDGHETFVATSVHKWMGGVIVKMLNEDPDVYKFELRADAPAKTDSNLYNKWLEERIVQLDKLVTFTQERAAKLEEQLEQERGARKREAKPCGGFGVSQELVNIAVRGYNLPIGGGFGDRLRVALEAVSAHLATQADKQAPESERVPKAFELTNSELVNVGSLRGMVKLAINIANVDAGSLRSALAVIDRALRTLGPTEREKGLEAALCAARAELEAAHDELATLRGEVESLRRCELSGGQCTYEPQLAEARAELEELRKRTSESERERLEMHQAFLAELARADKAEAELAAAATRIGAQAEKQAPEPERVARAEQPGPFVLEKDEDKAFIEANKLLRTSHKVPDKDELLRVISLLADAVDRALRTLGPTEREHELERDLEQCKRFHTNEWKDRQQAEAELEELKLRLQETAALFVAENKSKHKERERADKAKAELSGAKEREKELERELLSSRSEADLLRKMVEDLPPKQCPLTGEPFFMTLQHPEHGWLATYGGPYDSYTIPSADVDDGTFTRLHFCHDRGEWLELEGLSLRVVDDGDDALSDAKEREKELERSRDRWRSDAETSAARIAELEQRAERVEQERDDWCRDFHGQKARADKAEQELAELRKRTSEPEADDARTSRIDLAALILQRHFPGTSDLAAVMAAREVLDLDIRVGGYREEWVAALQENGFLVYAPGQWPSEPEGDRLTAAEREWRESLHDNLKGELEIAVEIIDRLRVAMSSKPRCARRRATNDDT